MMGRKRMTTVILSVVCALVPMQPFAGDAPVKTFVTGPGRGNLGGTSSGHGGHGGFGGLGIGSAIGIGIGIGSRLGSGGGGDDGDVITHHDCLPGTSGPHCAQGEDYPPCSPHRKRLCRITHNDAPKSRKCPSGTIGKYPKCKTIKKIVNVIEHKAPKTPKKEVAKTKVLGVDARINTKKKSEDKVAVLHKKPSVRHTEYRNKVPRFRPAEVLVVVRGANPDSVAEQISRSYSLTLRETANLSLLPDTRVFRFYIPDNRSVEVLATAISTTPNVSAYPNFYHVLQSRTVKTTKPLSQTQPELQYALPKMHVPAAQKLATGRGVVIALIDSGVDTHHPAFAGANLTVIDVAEDGVKGVDKHGTAIAGILSGRGEMKGIAPDATIIAIRAFASEYEGEQPVTTSLRLAHAVDQASQKGARIFNMSFAGPRDPLLIEIIDSAYAKGGTFVAAAGNEGPDAPPAFPAAYEKVIAITATDENDHLYAHANRGAYVAAAAPGVDIWAPVTNEGFDYLSGTSFAAAHVTGIIALLRQRNPNISDAETRRILIGTAHNLPQDDQQHDAGAGIADALASLQGASTLANK